jgi:hypothetical protein
MVEQIGTSCALPQYTSRVERFPFSRNVRPDDTFSSLKAQDVILFVTHGRRRPRDFSGASSICRQCDRWWVPATHCNAMDA